MARTFVNSTNDKAENTSGAPVTGVPLTVCAWAKVTQDPTTNDLCILQITDQSATNQYFRLGLDDSLGGTFQFAAQDGLFGDADGTTIPNQNQWYHVCGVAVATNSRILYVNGSQEGTNGSTITPTGLDSVAVGRENDSSPDDSWEGDLAEVAIWDVALTADEVAALAAGANPLTVRPQSLVAYWPLMGRVSPEPDVLGGYPLTLTNTSAANDHPPILGWVVPITIIDTAAPPAAGLIADGNLALGGAVVEASGGTKYAIFVSGTGVLEVWSAIDGTPSLEDSDTATTIHGGGSIGFCHAAIDSNDDIHIVAVCTTDQTRDCSYAIFSAGTIGTWEEAGAYAAAAPANPGCSISIDSNDKPHVLYVNAITFHGADYDQISYVEKTGVSWSTPETISDTTNNHYNSPSITIKASDNAEAIYYNSNTGDPTYKTRTSGTWGSASTYAETTATIGFGGITVDSGATVRRYHVDTSQNIDENNTDTTFNTDTVGQRISATLNGTDRYIFYLDTSDDVHLISNNGGGWTDEGALQAGTYDWVIAQWSYNNNNQSGELNYIFEDGTNVYYDSFSLAAPGYVPKLSIRHPMRDLSRRL